METAYIALGSNLGDREAYLEGALAALRAAPGVEVVRVSPIYETEPVGPPGQGPHLNAVAQLETELSARELLALLHRIEDDAGRARGHVRNAPRTLDLDLVLFGDRKIDEPGLTVPHPRLHERGFVLVPFADIAPDRVHPVLGMTVEALADRVRDPAAVRPFRD